MAATTMDTLAGWLDTGPLAWAVQWFGHNGTAATAAPDAPQAAGLPRPVRVECLGELEILRRAAPGACDEVTSRCLRWQGRALRIGRRGVDAVFVLGHGDTAATPDVLVHACDDGLAGAFHLLFQRDGQLHTRRLCPTTGGAGTVRVLGPMASPAPVSRHRPLAGARWLMLGDAWVCDVRQRLVRAVPALPAEMHVWHSVAPLGLSPDGCCLARMGSVAVGDERVPHVLVADLLAGRWTALPLDRSRMRYATLEMLDPAWLAHHWAWQRDADGRDRLVERRHFRPLPWRGAWGLDGCSYRLPGASAQAAAVCTDFLVRRFRAEVLPRHACGGSVLMRVQGELVQVQGDGFHVVPRALGGLPSADERAPQAALARRLGEAFEEELATGRHDAALATTPVQAPAALPLREAA